MDVQPTKSVRARARVAKEAAVKTILYILLSVMVLFLLVVIVMLF